MFLFRTYIGKIDVPERVQYKLGVVMVVCTVTDRPLHTSVRRLSTAASSIHYSAFLVVPRCRLSTLRPRAFSVAGPSLWNSTRPLERSVSRQEQLQTSAENAYIDTVLKYLAY